MGLNNMHKADSMQQIFGQLSWTWPLNTTLHKSHTLLQHAAACCLQAINCNAMSLAHQLHAVHVDCVFDVSGRLKQHGGRSKVAGPLKYRRASSSHQEMQRRSDALSATPA
jgi:protein gp37